jgi:hypothetical protein
MILVGRLIFNIEGALVNDSSVRVHDRIDAVSRILYEQRAFPASGYDEKKQSYWARPDERYVHRWSIVVSVR